ncbi:putative holin-like toxin [Brevibacillus sp. 179-C8.2 HS]|uniref:putative holin-like toxin n=1 Tax=unclassified Brevibacillus TaxID=2684853 RepID=UPI0039A01BA0
MKVHFDVPDKAIFLFRYGIIFLHNRNGSSRVVGSLSTPSGKGGETMTVYEALSLMLAFGMLLVAILSFHKRK